MHIAALGVDLSAAGAGPLRCFLCMLLPSPPPHESGPYSCGSLAVLLLSLCSVEAC